MKAADWIDLVKQRQGWASDYRVSKELGLSKNVVSNYRSKPMTMDERTAMKVAAALGEKPEVILLDQAMELSKSDEARSAFGRALKRIGGAMKPPSRAVASGGSGTGRGGLNITSATSNDDNLYIVSSVWQALKAALMPVMPAQLAPG